MDLQTNQFAEINVTYKPLLKPEHVISTSYDAYKIFLHFFPEDSINLQERFVVMYLNRRNKVLGLYTVSTGGVSGTVADPRLILGVAVKIVASAIILAHNHPSGSLHPSKADIELTQKIKQAASYLDVIVMDHIILTPNEDSYYSFADEAGL